MITLLGLIGVYLAAVLIGKQIRRITAGTVVLLLLLAILQTGCVLVDMFLKHLPPQ
ncbi:MAG TPA: hypothetical protein VL633_10110 [Bacteroidota bacterium]|jgi:hypothetical protein|nr:hypothetical protein [Bacteroidota bacterium]